LHAVLGVPPPIEKASLSRQVYHYAPFPYRDLSLSLGADPRNGQFATTPDPSPRAFVVYGAEVGDYDAILNQLARGRDIRQCALLEKPLAEPLPQQGAWPGTAAAIRSFEPNCFLIDVTARTNALLVLAEAWYPGWRAEIDGRAGVCVPANIWMRAVAVPAGRHVVRVYFRQNYLLAGLLISLASVGLLLVAVAKPGCRLPPAPREGEAANMPAAPRAGLNGSLEQHPQPLAGHPSALSTHRPLVRALTAGIVLAFVWLVARTNIQRVRLSQTRGAEVEALSHCRMGETLALQHQTAQAMVHFTEAVRLAERACELTGYRDPMLLGTLAFAYAEAGRLNAALATASKGRDLALASGQTELADRLRKLIEGYQAQQPARAGHRK
jgi:hypothetical protein